MDGNRPVVCAPRFHSEVPDERVIAYTTSTIVDSIARQVAQKPATVVALGTICSSGLKLK